MYDEEEYKCDCAPGFGGTHCDHKVVGKSAQFDPNKAEILGCCSRSGTCIVLDATETWLILQ